MNSKAKLRKYLKENAPTNSMGASSSTPGTGNIDTFDPVMRFHKRDQKDDLKAFLERQRKLLEHEDGCECCKG